MNVKPFLKAVLKKSKNDDQDLRIVVTAEDDQRQKEINQKREAKLEVINNEVNSISEQIESFKDTQASINKKIALLEANDKAIVNEICKIRDSVNNSLKQDFIESRLKPMLNEIADLSLKLQQIHKNHSNDSTSKLTNRLPVLMESFLEHLRVNCGVELIIPQKGSDFDEKLHIAVMGIDTENTGLNRKIQMTQKPGLIYKHKIIRPAKVAVYRYIKNVS
jgi:molecular chaperone GrpE (heat shock protein)